MRKLTCIVVYAGLTCCDANKFSSDDPRGIYQLDDRMSFTACAGAINGAGVRGVQFTVEEGTGTSIVLNERLEVAHGEAGLRLVSAGAVRTYMPLLSLGDQVGLLFVDPQSDQPIIARKVGECH
jgi:hypothetical protein